MASLDSALLNVPVLREMLALEQFDTGQRAQRAAETLRVIDAAGKLAEIQSMPAMARLRQAQADKAMFEVEQARRAQEIAGRAAATHLRPREVPVHGPTQPGEAPLGSVIQQPGAQGMQGFVQELMQNPETLRMALDLKKDMRGEYIPIPAGGLYHTGTETTIPGTPTNPLEKARQSVEEARASGDSERIALAEDYYKRVAQGSSGTGTMAQIRRIVELVTKARQGIPLTEAEKIELDYLRAIIAREQMVIGPQGEQRPYGPLQIPYAGGIVDSVLGTPTPGPGAAPGQRPPAGRAPPTGGRGEPLPLDEGGGAKPLGTEQRTKLEARTDYTNMLRALVQDYEEGFSPKLARLDPTGLAAAGYKEVDRRGWNPARADWWRGLERFYAPERHELYGATLTVQEKGAYDELRTLMKDSPHLVYSHLRSMLEKSESEQGALVRSLKMHHAGVDDYAKRENPYAFGKRGISRSKFTESVEEVTVGNTTRPLKVRRWADGRVDVYDNGQWNSAKEK